MLRHPASPTAADAARVARLHDDLQAAVGRFLKSVPVDREADDWLLDLYVEAACWVTGVLRMGVIYTHVPFETLLDAFTTMVEQAETWKARQPSPETPRMN